MNAGTIEATEIEWASKWQKDGKLGNPKGERDCYFWFRKFNLPNGWYGRLEVGSSPHTTLPRWLQAIGARYHIAATIHHVATDNAPDVFNPFLGEMVSGWFHNLLYYQLSQEIHSFADEAKEHGLKHELDYYLPSAKSARQAKQTAMQALAATLAGESFESGYDICDFVRIEDYEMPLTLRELIPLLDDPVAHPEYANGDFPQ